MILNTIDRKQILRLIQLCLLAILITANSCEEDRVQPKPPSSSKNKILPLGASRVEGARPDFESYRYELWKLLRADDWDFDYVGTQTDEADYEDLAEAEFDRDHEGRGGWTSGEIREGLEGWLENVGAVDIVLFSSPGGNDILNGLASFDETVANLNAIIDLLQERNPNVTILIEELAPGMSSFMTPELTQNFERMQEVVIDIAAQQTTGNARVLTVDMFTGFNDSLLADEVHYNEAGAQFVAERYHDILKDLLER